MFVWTLAKRAVENSHGYTLIKTYIRFPLDCVLEESKPHGKTSILTFHTCFISINFQLIFFHSPLHLVEIIRIRSKSMTVKNGVLSTNYHTIVLIMMKKKNCNFLVQLHWNVELFIIHTVILPWWYRNSVNFFTVYNDFVRTEFTEEVKSPKNTPEGILLRESIQQIHEHLMIF